MTDQIPYPLCDLKSIGCPCRRPDYDGPYEDSRPCDCNCHLDDHPTPPLDAPLTPTEAAEAQRVLDLEEIEQDVDLEAEGITPFWAETTLALVARVRVLERALELAAIRLGIAAGRMRACHEETGQHELLDEIEMFEAEARAALRATTPDAGEEHP